MPIFLEKYVLPVLAFITGTVILLNPFKFDKQQQVSLFVAILAIAYFVGHTLHKWNQAEVGSPGTPPGGATVTSSTPITDTGKTPEAGLRATQKDETGNPINRLNLSFKRGATAHDSVQKAFWFQPVVLTNQSNKNMSLSFRWAVRLKQDDGQMGWRWLDGEWNGEIGKRGSGSGIIEVPKETTVTGTLVFNLYNPKIVRILKWDIDEKQENSVMEIYDRITDIRVYCTSYLGYPPGIPLPNGMVVIRDLTQ